MNTSKKLRIALNIALAATLIVACEKQNNLPAPASTTQAKTTDDFIIGPTPIGFLSPWLVRKSIPGPLGVKGRYDAWSYSIGSRGYIGGGNVTNRAGSTSPANDQYYFDSTTLSWTQTASNPGNTLAGASSFVIDRKAYVCTGSSETAYVTNENWQYNSASNVWTRKNPFPGGARIWAVGAASGGKGYVGTGSSEHDGEGIQYGDWWQYDPKADSWARKANYTTGGGRYHAVTFTSPAALGGKIYLGTGNYAVNANDAAFQAYDPATDTWTITPSMPANTGRAWAVGLSLLKGGFVLTGFNGVTGGDNDAYEFNFTTNKWTQIPNVQGGRIAAAGFALGNDLYIAGGFNYVNATEVARDDMYVLHWTN